jgi:hypothetical protein
MSKPTTPPRNYACTHVNADGSLCRAAVGERCNWQGDDATYLHATKFHAERIIASEAFKVDGSEYNRAQQDAIHAAL